MTHNRAVEMGLENTSPRDSAANMLGCSASDMKPSCPSHVPHERVRTSLNHLHLFKPPLQFRLHRPLCSTLSPKLASSQLASNPFSILPHPRPILASTHRSAPPATPAALPSTPGITVVEAILPVHLYGQPCDMDKIMAIAKKYNLYVIEDCCQAIGAEYKGQKVGTFGDIGCYSFYPTKNLGTMGDGGLAITNDENLKNRIISLRNHGGAIRYHHDEIGVNSRLDEIQAAILRVKLPYIDEWNKSRRAHAAYYNELFKSVEGIETPKELDNTYCVYHQYTIKIENRDEVHKMLQENGIGAMIYYPIPLHLQKVHEYLGFKEGYLPKTEKNTKLVLSLPMFAEITKEEQETVAKTVIECVKKCLVKA